MNEETKYCSTKKHIPDGILFQPIVIYNIQCETLLK
jgi:hypothetical protein